MDQMILEASIEANLAVEAQLSHGAGKDVEAHCYYFCMRPAFSQTVPTEAISGDGGTRGAQQPDSAAGAPGERRPLSALRLLSTPLPVRAARSAPYKARGSPPFN